MFRPAAYEYYIAEGKFKELPGKMSLQLGRYYDPSGWFANRQLLFYCLPERPSHIQRERFRFPGENPLPLAASYPPSAQINFPAVVASRTRSIRSAINRENATGRNKYNNRIGKQSVSVFGRKSGFTGPGFRILNPEGRPIRCRFVIRTIKRESPIWPNTYLY